MGSIVANIFASLGPYIIFLGTEVDVRYPYLISGRKYSIIFKVINLIAIIQV